MRPSGTGQIPVSGALLCVVSPSKAGLHLLVDSTGIKFLGEGEWKCKKHGAEYRCQWSKLHIGIDADTLQIRAICVTSNNVSDASVLSDLLAQLSPDDTLKSLTGDGAYDTQPAYEAVARHGAIPIIPPRKNARIRKGAVFGYRNAAMLRAGVWAAVSGSAGLATAREAWWKPR